MTDHKSQSNDHAELSHDPAKDWYDFEPPNEALDYEPIYATLHFYYNDPDSMRRFRLCNQAEDMKLALLQYDNKLRAFAKYGVKNTVYAEQEPEEVIRMVRELFHSYLNDHGIDLED